MAGETLFLGVSVKVAAEGISTWITDWVKKITFTSVGIIQSKQSKKMEEEQIPLSDWAKTLIFSCP